MSEIKFVIKGLNIDRTIAQLSSKVKSIKNIKRLAYDQLEFEIDKQDFEYVKKQIKYFDYTIFDKSKEFFKKIIATFLSFIVVLPIILTFAILSSRVLWKIEINSSGNIKQDEIMAILNDNGIKVGKNKSVDAQEIEKLLLKNDKVAQCSCVYVGTTLIINISEKLVYTPTIFEPIRATFSGIIKHIDVSRGELNCRVGDFVHQGDILVLPYITDREGNNVSVEPKAKIEGCCYVSYTAILPRETKVLVSSGRTKSHTRVCWEKQKNDFSSYKPFVFYELKVYNTYISSVLPIVRQKLVFVELTESKVTNDLSAEQTSNENKSKLFVRENLPEDIEVLEEKTISLIANDTLFSTTTISFDGSII